MATCSASFSSIGLSGLASGACAASPASACCSVYCARTGIALKRDWNVGTSMRCSESFRDFPSCANNPSIARTSSSSTLYAPPPVPSPPPVPGTPPAPPAAPLRNNAEAVSHFPGVALSVPGVPTPPPTPVPPPPSPPPTPRPTPRAGPRGRAPCPPPPAPPATGGARAPAGQVYWQLLVRVSKEPPHFAPARPASFLCTPRGLFDPRHRRIFG